MQKILFLDRDGTIVIEPPIDYQLDSFDKLEFFPYIFKYLTKIVEELDYILIMVTNQDGLGTDSFPESDFWPVHNKIIISFKNEGVNFKDILIDKSFPHENSPNRKPKVGLVSEYSNNENYDIKNSYVIGDRLTDMELAKNMGAGGIYLNKDNMKIQADLLDVIKLKTYSWKDIYFFLKENS